MALLEVLEIRYYQIQLGGGGGGGGFEQNNCLWMEAKDA